MSILHPTPWEFEEHELSDGLSCIVYDARGVRVSRLDYLDRETAAEIVRGVNALSASLAAALAEALRTAIKIAGEARREWDAAPSGMKAGKLLIALSGGCKNYRVDIDHIHAALAAWDSAQKGEG